MKLRLKEQREKAHMDQLTLSKKSGVGRITISRLETGTQTNVMVGTLVMLSDALGCSVSDLLDFDAS